MSRSRVDFDEREYLREVPRRAPVREYDDDPRARNDRLPAFMREDLRRADPGQLVLRQREVETVERPRQRSPSPVRVSSRSTIVERTRSVSPAPRRMEDDVRFRRVVREASRGPVDRVRFVPERERERSPEVQVQQRIRVVERERERERAPSPAPPPRPMTPKIIKGPTVEREVITHYRDIDHGEFSFIPPRPFPDHPLTPGRSCSGSPTISSPGSSHPPQHRDRHLHLAQPNRGRHPQARPFPHPGPVRLPGATVTAPSPGLGGRYSRARGPQTPARGR
jgi:hypothetical protein